MDEWLDDERHRSDPYTPHSGDSVLRKHRRTSDYQKRALKP